MSDTELPAAVQLGFLTVFQDGPAWLGGLLVTNSWGRPLEFRLSTAVQPNRVQQILYGATLTEYLCTDLIGKTLIEKTASPVHLLFTDTLACLPIRSRMPLPVLAVLSPDQAAPPLEKLEAARSDQGLWFDPRHESAETLKTLLERVDGSVDPGEPFSRIREAMNEARRVGVVNRAA